MNKIYHQKNHKKNIIGKVNRQINIYPQKQNQKEILIYKWEKVKLENKNNKNKNI